MDDQTWQRLVNDVAEHFEDITLKRGFQYYRQKRVAGLMDTGNGSLQAVVEGGEVYRVHVDLDFFEVSRCDCPVNGYCKHIAAVLMVYAERHGRSVHALANADTLAELRSAPVKSASSGGKVSSIDKLRKAKLEAASLAGANVDTWREWFRSCTARVADITRNPMFVKQALKTIRDNQPSLSAGEQPIFQLNARLYLLENLFAPLGNTSSYFLGYYSQLAVTDLVHELEGVLGAPLPAERDPVREARLLETLSFVRTGMLRHSQASPTFASVYGSMWQQWLYPAREPEVFAYEAELDRLAAEREALNGAYDSLYGALARARMQFYAGRDEEAMKELNATGRFRDGRSESALAFMDELKRGEEWPRLLAWLTGTEELFESDRRTIEPYFGLWDELVRENPEAESGMWSALIAMLPASGHFYEERLQHYGFWEVWLDYHLSIGTDPLELRATALQPAEKEAPEMLLPFYHQAVERYVSLRNRDGYKAATKLLKRLAKLYKKLKRSERWESFFDAFSERHSRLRALQEELRKGKLLS
ncbi:SWIM zinc finger family protein [Cohnella yongneupensis]|uniref:SWIM zinc finger domain-containing protein n=1 Tax=Cohnella yongneupensis TaxID=425006 RepID=A0ABW0QTB8_9BACL